MEIRMDYKMKQRSNPLDPDAPMLWFATPVISGQVSQKDISEEIVELSALSRGDVSSAVDNLLLTVSKYMLMGKSVNQGCLGTFRISFTSDGVEVPKNFRRSMLKRVKAVFIPSPELRKKLKDVKLKLLKGEKYEGPPDEDEEAPPTAPEA